MALAFESDGTLAQMMKILLKRDTLSAMLLVVLPGFAAVFTWCMTACAGPTAPTNCEAALEIILVVDSSGSIALTAGAFDRLKTFANSVVSSFTITPAGAHFGLVDFSNRADTRLILGLTGDTQAIHAAIDSIPFFGNGTDTSSGLAQAQAELEANGQISVNRAIVLITDGQADDGPAAVSAATNSKAAGTKIFTIGVTSQINFAQLQQIASEPVSSTVFTVDDFSALPGILQQLVVDVCAPTGADLSVTKSGTPNPVLVGSHLTYTLTVSNLGPNRANGIVLTDALPKAAGFVSANATQGNCSQAGGIITCSLGVLEKGAAATITILTTALKTGLSAACGEALEIMLVVDSSGALR